MQRVPETHTEKQRRIIDEAVIQETGENCKVIRYQAQTVQNFWDILWGEINLTNLMGKEQAKDSDNIPGWLDHKA